MKLKHIKISVVFVVTVVIAYLLLGVWPYLGKAYVSAQTRAAFDMNNFFGEYESPERVMLLETPHESFFHRVNLISMAQEEILFSSFAFHEGTSSDIIIGALLAAADRGVNVRIVYNAIGGFMRGDYRNILAPHPNIDVFSYSRWRPFYPQNLNTALHDKFMIVDQNALILGGRNISDRYFVPEGFVGSVTYDREVLVYNTDPGYAGSIADTADYFNAILKSDRAHLHDIRMGNNWEARHSTLVTAYHTYLESLGTSDFDYYANTTRVNRITLVTNPLYSTKNDSTVAYNLMRITQNSNVIVAQSPYVVFTRRNMRLFAEAVAGRDFTLSTNSLAAAVNIPAFSAYYVSRRRLVDTGIAIYEFQDTTSSIHGKTYLFDGRLTAIGSFNMNERSIRCDTESMLVIDSVEFHAIVLDAINRQIARSLRVAPDLSYVLCDYVQPGHVPWSKRLLYNTAGRALRVFRFMF